jgi:hypothetical protein
VQVKLFRFYVSDMICMKITAKTASQRKFSKFNRALVSSN